MFYGFSPSLEIEEVVGGNLAFLPNYKHQVAIFGMHNKSNNRYLLCNGGIIADFFILSNTQCFLGINNELRKQRFYIMVGLLTLAINHNATKEIVNIYVYGLNHMTTRDNLAVLELAESLNLHISTVLKSLNLPNRNESFEGREGLVAGYGLTSIRELSKVSTRTKNRITNNSKQNLTYAYVNVIQKENCAETYFFIKPEKDMCGIIKPNFIHRHRGLCTYDEGAPLVIENTVIGIADATSINCDDTVIGGVYTQISPSIDFVLGVMSGDLSPGTMIHPNRIHIR